MEQDSYAKVMTVDMEFFIVGAGLAFPQLQRELNLSRRLISGSTDLPFAHVEIRL